jgi:hypothetical protein
MNFVKLFFILTMVAQPLAAQIHQLTKMENILPAIDANTMVVFDIDNTLANPLTELGTDQSFKWMKAGYLKKGYDDAKATTKALSYWAEVQSYIDVVPVERTTPIIVRRLQSKGLKVMALTARSPKLARRTLQQIGRVGYQFTRSSVMQGVKYIPVGNRKPMHVNGVVFAEGADKGQVLFKILQTMKSVPKRVVFVDDKLHHGQEVLEAIRRLGIEVHAFRYGAADQRVKTFDPRIAGIQAAYLGRLLSNKDAKTLLQNR